MTSTGGYLQSMEYTLWISSCTYCLVCPSKEINRYSGCFLCSECSIGILLANQNYPGMELHFEACDLPSGELDSGFESQHMPPVLQAFLKAAKGEDFSGEIDTLKDFCYKNDIEWSAVSRHPPLLKDVVVRTAPDVKVVTSIQTVCEAINSNHVYKEMPSSVHLLLRLYMTIPITSARSERRFSAYNNFSLTYGHLCQKRD